MLGFNFTPGVKRVKLDPFHFMSRLKMPKKHPLFKSFMSALRRAIFIESAEDLKAVKDALVSRGMSKKDAGNLNNRYLVSNQYVRRIIPSVRLNLSLILFLFQLIVRLTS